MGQALEAMPAAGLGALLVLAAVAGWVGCRLYDQAAFYLADARDLATRGGRTAARGVRRLALAVLVVCGGVFLLGLVYTSTHD